MAVKLEGRVTSAGQAVPGALVRLVGDEGALGADPQAVANCPSAVTWTRVITSFGGSLWNCWQRFVARDVAGVTWAEFRSQAGRYNPTLPETDYRLDAGRTYFLPENSPPPTASRSPRLDIAWDRTLAGFGGSRWAAWQQYVRGKVIGLSWEQFRVAPLQGTAAPTPQGGHLAADERYRLPRNGEQTEYARAELSGSAGRFGFDRLQPGHYRLEVTAQGYQTAFLPLELNANANIEVSLTPIAAQTPRSMAAPGAALAAAPAEAGDFVQCSGGKFAVGGQSFAFIGVNLRGLVHYGTPQMHLADARTELKAARDMGARVVRVFLPHSEVPLDEIKNRLGKLIGIMKQEFPGMYLIVALTNLYGDVPFHVPGDDDKNTYTLREAPQWPFILNVDWFKDTYKLRYLPFVEMMVGAFPDEPAIMAYDIGNELKAHEAPDLFIEFNHTMASRIKELAPRQLVTTGMIATRVAYMSGNEDQRRRLYSLPQLDFITVHAYHDLGNNRPSPNDDADLARVLGKPYLVEEAGFEAGKNVDRGPLVRQEMDQLFALGASGYMPWGFMSGQDNNDGDRALGVDKQFHGDWNSLFGAFRERADHLQNTSVPVTPATSVFTTGMQVFTCTVVNLRQSAGLAGVRVCSLPARTRLEVEGTAVQRDGLTWWPVRGALADGTAVEGWAAQTAPTGEVLLSNV